MRDGEFYVIVVYDNNIYSSNLFLVNNWNVYGGVKGFFYYVLCDEKRLGCRFYF